MTVRERERAVHWLYILYIIGATVSFSQLMYEVVEGIGVLRYGVSVSGIIDRDITVSVNDISVSANS